MDRSHDDGFKSSDPQEQDRELAELQQDVLTAELADLAAAADLTHFKEQVFEHWERDFGEKMRQWRKARNWSQEDVANKLRTYGFDMHQTTVAKIERGARPLRVAEAAAIAFIFRVPPLAVFLGPPAEPTPWALGALQKTISTAQTTLEMLRDQMKESARQFVEQEAEVLALARILNETALDAETRQTASEPTEKRGQDDPEA